MEYYAIARSINPRTLPLSESIQGIFRHSYGGADDPADDTDITATARNHQFELWLAAWLTAGGKRIRQAEPDLELAYRFEWRGVAAKRVRSRRHIRKRVRNAAEQVKRNTGTGFVAISLDNFSTVRAIKARSDLAAGKKFFNCYPEIHGAARYLQEKETHIRGLLCFGHYARWSGHRHSSKLHLSNLSQIYLFPSDLTDIEYLSSYFEEQGEQFKRAMRT